MLAAGAPSAGNSAAQVRRSRGGRGSGSTNGRAACKCPGPDEPMRAAAALRRGTGWLRGEAGPEGGTAPVIHAPVPYTHAGPAPGPVPTVPPRTPKLSAKQFSALPQRRGAPHAAPGNQSPAFARVHGRGPGLAAARPEQPLGKRARTVHAGTGRARFPRVPPRTAPSRSAVQGRPSSGAEPEEPRGQEPGGTRAAGRGSGSGGAQPVLGPLRCHRDAPNTVPPRCPVLVLVLWPQLHRSKVRTRNDCAHSTSTPLL